MKSFKEIWKDPVWSKVIASFIIGLSSVVTVLFTALISDDFQTAIQKNYPTVYKLIEIIYNPPIKLGYVILLIVFILLLCGIIIRIIHRRTSKRENELTQRETELNKKENELTKRENDLIEIENNSLLLERLSLFNVGDKVKHQNDPTPSNIEYIVINKTASEIVCSQKGGDRINFSPFELNTASEYKTELDKYNAQINRNMMAFFALNRK